MARGGQRRNGARRSSQRARARQQDDSPMIQVLARHVRQVETAVQKGAIATSVAPRFQAIALLAREERHRIKADPEIAETRRGNELKRLDGIATILAQTAARNPALFELLADEVPISDQAKSVRREMLEQAGETVAEEEPSSPVDPDPTHVRRVEPHSVTAAQLANPFLTPDFDAAAELMKKPGALDTWELLGPLFTAFETASGDSMACMPLPEPDDLRLTLPVGLELMRHQAQVVAAAAGGHRTFLLADEPGLGKTAQALLAAEAAHAYPLLVVVPNVVKTNWAREAELWTPRRTTTVVHGNGHDIDGFADIVIVNYEVLDRHAGWMGDHGFRGMVVDEAHFIKNKSSLRSQCVLDIADHIRYWQINPLLMALTGTPLINDIEDFQAIWEFLGWIDDKKPRPPLMRKLEANGLAPSDRGFYPAARRTVIDMGIVRRRKVDVAADIPARRVADLPVELDGEMGRSIRDAERVLAARLLARYDRVWAARRSGEDGEDGETTGAIDASLVRQVATWERDEADAESGENVFGMVRRIGQAKAGLAADYAAQLARNVGKVVFFAKHIDVMDTAEETFKARGLKYSSIRGDQTRTARDANIDAFVNDPEVAVIVCSLTAAGVGINLQVASNLVLAELSWTHAEQTQAIDRVHRIGQSEPVTAWRIIAAQTIDSRIAELIDDKAGLAARALDGAGDEVETSADIQVEALVSLLTEALEARG